MRLFYILVFISSLLFLIAPQIFPQITEYEGALFIITILLLGIPHGAVDHLVHYGNKKRSFQFKKKFYLKYLGAILLILSLWAIDFDLAFMVFLIISAYHFGESQLVKLNIKNKVQTLTNFVWGTQLLSGLIGFNYFACYQFFSEEVGFSKIATIPQEYWLLVYFISTSYLLIYYTYYFTKSKIKSFRYIYEVFCLLLLLFLFNEYSALYSFTLYFGFWHSLPSLILEFKSLRKSLQNPLNFILKLIPYTLISVAGLLALFFFTSKYFDISTIYLPFFILVSGLTLPHLVVMSRVYSKG